MTFHDVLILIRLVVSKNKNKYYYNIFLEKGSYKDKQMLYHKCYIMIELTFLKGLMLIKQETSKECDICHYRYFLIYSYKFQQNFCNSCHDLLMISIGLSAIAILNIKGCDFYYIISLISKSEAINLM